MYKRPSQVGRAKNCRIRGKQHLTYKCWNNPDKKVASSTDAVNDEGRFVSALVRTLVILKLREIIRLPGAAG